ncbi:hypothetical protein MUP07_05035 [Candidatus Bathyarchaeota archaeon]|nr:hypothetical protein [Candidatus Bathyarchaeota archaeon]
MKNSFILYSRVEVGEDLVDCVYLFKDGCRAQPILDKEAGYYKPTEEDQKIFCRNQRRMRTCPRLQTYEIYLKAIGLEKPEKATADYRSV